MALPLKHIYPVCGSNLGGLSVIRVIPVANVVAIPDPVAGIIQQPIQLLDDTNYADIFFPIGEGSFEEPQAEDEHGTFFKQKLKTFIPKDSPEFYDMYAALSGIKAIALYQDNNGFTKVVGTKDFPLSFSTDLNTGRRTRDTNGTDLVLSGDTDIRAPFYLHAEIIPDNTRKRFSTGFTFGFRRT